MKAVIVECSNSAAIALCDDGSFKRIPNQDYSIGQELFIRQKVSKNRTIRRLSICASLALFLSAFAGIGSYSYVKPYSYVSLDINPSIEYALNRYDKVIKVAGINDDGKQIVSSIESDVTNQSITAALSTTIEQLEKDNYISKEADNHVIISVCSNNGSKAKSLATKVNTLSEETSKLCSIDTVTVSKEVKDDADSLGITPGKLALIQAVAETSPEEEFDISQWKDKTVVELETTIQEANAKAADSKGTEPKDTVIDSEYLGSVLDDDTHSVTDSSVVASSRGAHEKIDSTITDDKKTSTKDTTSADADSTGLDSNVSQKPEADASTAQPAVSAEAGHESETTSKPADTGTTTKPEVPEAKPAETDTNVDQEITEPIPNNESTSQKSGTDSSSDNTTSKPSDDPSSASSSKNTTDESMNSSSSSSKSSGIKEEASSVVDTEEVPEVSSSSSAKKSAYHGEAGEEAANGVPEDIANEVPEGTVNDAAAINEVEMEEEL